MAVYVDDLLVRSIRSWTSTMFDDPPAEHAERYATTPVARAPGLSQRALQFQNVSRPTVRLSRPFI
eukprot:3781816-Amphidinium_carterae.1